MNKSLISWIIVFGLLGIGIPIIEVYGQENADASCSNTFETVIDLALIRIAPKISQIPLPDIESSAIKLSSLTITGLDSIKRNCDFSFLLQRESQNLTVKLCINIEEVILMGMAKLSLLSKNLNNIIKITLDDVQLQINITIPLKTGGPVHVNKFKIEDIRKVNIESEGVLSAFGGVVNLMLKSKVKELIINVLNKKLPGILNEEFKKRPI